nr:MAG TPA: hypothetical protein [Caudoviricetes sp.]
MSLTTDYLKKSVSTVLLCGIGEQGNVHYLNMPTPLPLISAKQ